MLQIICIILHIVILILYPDPHKMSLSMSCPNYVQIFNFTPINLAPNTNTETKVLNCTSLSYKNKYFELKSRGAPMGHPKFELLGSNGVATFVMQFSITLNARHTHIKRTRTCMHRHTHTHTQTHPHITQTPTDTHTHITQTHTNTDTDTHTHTCVVCVCVCACVRVCVRVCVCACVCQWQSTKSYMITPCNG